MRSLRHAREAGQLLVQLDDFTVALIEGRGDLQARRNVADMAAAAIADDDSAIVAVADTGRVIWLGPDLTPLNEYHLHAPALAAAIDPFGNYVVVSDRDGRLHLRDRAGRERGQFASPRPAHHLAFVPGTPLLAAAADFGWAGCLDLISGEWTWSDRPVSNIGSLAAAEAGATIAIACFSDGLRCYGPGGNGRSTLAIPGRCGSVALSFDGSRGIAAGPSARLYCFDTAGGPVEFEDLDQPPTAIALSPLGDRVFLGHADGTVLAATLK